MRPLGESISSPHSTYVGQVGRQDRKSTRLNSSHEWSSYAVFCLNTKSQNDDQGNHRDLQQERRAPADQTGDQTADQRPRGGTQAARAADHSEVLRPFFFFFDGDRRELHSFPTRRSSD